MPLHQTAVFAAQHQQARSRATMVAKARLLWSWLVQALTCHIAVLLVPSLNLGIHRLQKGAPLLHAAMVQLAKLPQDDGLAQPQRVLKMRKQLYVTYKQVSRALQGTYSVS
jgi:hypothetical protein